MPSNALQPTAVLWRAERITLSAADTYWLIADAENRPPESNLMSAEGPAVTEAFDVAHARREILLVQFSFQKRIKGTFPRFECA